MYARRQTRPKPRSAQPKMFPAPTAGWISNRNLATPQSIGEQQGAAILDNFFPRSSSVFLRRGKDLYATLGDGSQPCTSLFSYVNGNNEHLFATTPTTIYDITNVVFPSNQQIGIPNGDLIATEDGDNFGWGSTDNLDVMGLFTGGNWIVVQYATTGGVYLVGVNGQDTGFIYDGTTFYPNVAGGVSGINYDGLLAPFTEGDTLTGGTSGATGTIYFVDDNGDGTGTLWLTDVTGGPFQDNETITDTGGGSATADGAETLLSPGVDFGTSGLTTADMSYVFIYKERLWFIEKDGLTAWYMDADAIGGTANRYPMAGIFPRGGSLLFGQAWSLEGGAEGGLSEQVIFVSTEGEVAVFQGTTPDELTTWSKVGLYRIGTPLGNRAFMRGGGDLAIATSVGLVPLSKAISLDITSLNIATVSYNIADAWGDAITQRGLDNWQCEIWPEGKMAVISPPDLIGSSEPVLFISNTETGAWARYTNWHALCMEVFRGQLYFGSPEGKVYLANVSGLDDGETYTGAVMPLFTDLGSPSSAKVGKVGRAVVRAQTKIIDKVEMHVDFDLALSPPPDATLSGVGNTWGTGVWGQSIWGAATPSVINQEWRSLGEIGYVCSLAFQVTSGSLNPIDAELIRMEMTFTTAEVIS